MKTPGEHQPHILRPYLDEWCGGTEPPTIVTGHSAHMEAAVDIYPSKQDVHDGFMHAPEQSIRFAMFQDILTFEKVELLSRNALKQVVIKEGN